jgi:hypothetical protein
MADNPLAVRLRDLAADLDAGKVPPAAVARLDAALTSAGACALRDAALRRAGELLDPAGTLTRWARAHRLEDRLDRFEATAWPRIRSGHRQPRDALEVAFTEALRCSATCPRSARRLYDVLI